MRKFILLFFFIQLFLVTFSQEESYCDKQAPKISYKGKAPWSIDGKIDDWTKILGSYNNTPVDPYFPFSPPQSSAFNWVLDGVYDDEGYDQPPVQSDMRFLSFTHDDYNVYFYFRRIARSAIDPNMPFAPSRIAVAMEDVNTFYYFMDVNVDGVMNNGEPVVHATFTQNTISALTLSRYMVNEHKTYDSVKKGNYLSYWYDDFYNEYYNSGNVNGAPLVGTTVEVFNAASLPNQFKLKRNEIFGAALTEDGYGVELAIPWRFLRLWKEEGQKGNSNKNQKENVAVKYQKADPLNPGDIFFYHASMQQGAGLYKASAVVDNAGSCWGGVGISGNVNVSKSITTTTIKPGSSYRFDLKYKNLTNAATEVGIEEIKFDFPESLTNIDFIIKVYPDYNCNGKVDAGEIALPYADLYGFVPYEIYCDDFGNNCDKAGTSGPVVTIPAYGNGCFMAFVTLPSSLTNTPFTIGFEASVFFAEGTEECEKGCGGKPINQIGRVSTSVGTATIMNVQKKVLEEDENTNSDVIVYPNPSNGNVTISLPQDEGRVDVILEDYIGRSIQQWKNIGSDKLQLTGLKRGIYIVKVNFHKSGRTETKKIIVQ